jgi:hypothetical protein
MKKAPILLFAIAIVTSLQSQHINGNYEGRKISFPDIPGYITLKTDLHMHTVLSDGEVWPSIRVQEAMRDGLDAISITDHIEYQPHENDIPHPDRNRSFDIASKSAASSPLMIINGAEITRNMPPGHANAIFLEDVNKLNIDDSVKAFKEAKKQGAFIFWNHPNYEAQYTDGMARLDDLHKKLIRRDLIHGIEVANDITYSDEALQIALDNDLTILGTSDIHGLVDWQYDVPSGGHRPITLVFATERSVTGLKEALFDKRTVVFFRNLLIGRKSYLLPLMDACIEPTEAVYLTTWAGSSTVARVLIENNCDAPFILSSRNQFTFHDAGDIIILEPNSITELKVKTIDELEAFQLKFEVLNAITAPDTHPEIVMNIKVSKL